MVNFELRMNGRAIATLEVDAEVLRQLLHSPTPAPASEAPMAPCKSDPLTPAEASELLSRLDKSSREFLARFVEEHGALTWGETKMLFDVKTWDEFVEGPAKRIEKALRRVVDDKNATLIWRVEHEWIGLEKGEDEVCRLHIDGPAFASLRTAVRG